MNEADRIVLFQALEALERRIGERFDKRFDRVDERFDLVDERFANVEERISRVDDRLTVEADSIRAAIGELRGDIRVVAREIIDASDLTLRTTVRASEARLQADADRRHAENTTHMSEAWRDTAAHVDRTAKELGEQIGVLDQRVAALERSEPRR